MEEELKKLYLNLKNSILEKLKEFEKIRSYGTDKDLFIEMVFCLLTPQSSALLCWETVNKLKEENLIFKGNWKELSNVVHPVRFKNNKAKYIVEARKFLKGGFSIKKKLSEFGDDYQRRDWLVSNIKGYGFKEASHFLRNTGFGRNLAILDRHILKNLKKNGIIKEIPSSLSKKKYFEIEIDMQNWSRDLGIPIDYMDYILWYKETGVIFK